MTIDIHTHIMPPTMPRWAERFGYEGFVHVEREDACTACMYVGERFFRRVGKNTWSPEARIDDCDRHGVDVQVLSIIPVLFYYWAKPNDALQTAQYFNDYIAEVVTAHPGRFVGLATLPMQDVHLACKEMERAKRELGLAGVEIGTHVNGVNLSDRRFDEFFDTAQALDMAIFVHPWDVMARDRLEKYWLPWLVSMPAETSAAICSLIFGGVFRRYPRLRFAFAHGGGSFPMTFGRIQHGFDVRPDLCAVDNDEPPSAYLGHFWVDSIVHNPDVLHFLILLLGEDAVCLGSDYPFPLGELEPGRLIRQDATLSDRVKRKLLGTNALRWLYGGTERVPRPLRERIPTTQSTAS